MLPRLVSQFVLLRAQRAFVDHVQSAASVHPHGPYGFRRTMSIIRDLPPWPSSAGVFAVFGPAVMRGRLRWTVSLRSGSLWIVAGGCPARRGHNTTQGYSHSRHSGRSWLGRSRQVVAGCPRTVADQPAKFTQHVDGPLVGLMVPRWFSSSCPAISGTGRGRSGGSPAAHWASTWRSLLLWSAAGQEPRAWSSMYEPSAFVPAIREPCAAGPFYRIVAFLAAGFVLVHLRGGRSAAQACALPPAAPRLLARASR
jgi:hypothetical protein